MEIRARISLEVAKFKANAKQAAGSFKVIASSAKISTDKIDGYLSKSAAKRSAQLRRSEAQEVESLKRKQKAISKFELEKVRNTGGIKAGTNAGRPLGLVETKAAAQIQKSMASRVAFAIKSDARMVSSAVKASAQRVKLQLKEKAIVIKSSTQAFATKSKYELKFAALSAKEGAKTAAKKVKYEAQYVSTAIKEWHKLSRAKGKYEKEFKKVKKVELSEYFRTEEFERKLASTRYAMYDIGRRALVFGAAIASGFAMATKAAIDFESAFTSVERTSEVTLNSNIPEVRAQANLLRDTLIKLSTEIPVAFADIAEIATLGAQLGLAAEDLDGFTESVAKFSAITGISVDTVALSFGRLAELMDVPASKFENLSSAIAFTGINAVATDAEILKMAESISAAASVAGFAADETVGLASALSSLKVRPQAARGVLTRLFRNFDLAVSESGEKLDDLASLIGLTSLESTKLWNQDPSEFFTRFIEGAKATGELNKTLKSLGIVNVRELDVIQRLSANMPVLTDALADTKEQFELGTYASEAYALVVDDVASRITMMQNAVATLGASFGEVLLPMLGFIVDKLKNLATSLAESPKAVKWLVGSLVALTAGAALFFASIAFGIAGLLAMKLAFDNLSGGTVKAGLSLNTLRALMISMIPASAGVTASTSLTSFAFDKLTKSVLGAAGANRVFKLSLGVLGLALIAAGAVWAFADSASNAKKKTEELSKAVFDAAGGIDAFVEASESGSADGGKVFREITTSIKELSKGEIDATRSTLAAREARLRLNQSTEESKQEYEDALTALTKFNDEIERGSGITEESTIAITEQTKKIIVNSLTNVQQEGRDPFSIFDSLSSISPGAKARLESAGTDAYSILEGAIDAGAEGKDPLDFIGESIEGIRKKDPWGTMFDQGYNDFINDIYAAGYQINTLFSELTSASKERTLVERLLGKNPEDDIVDIKQLNDDLRDTVSIITSSELSENKVSDALDTFAQGVKNTSGELDGMGESAKINLKNFSDFMGEATEASIAASESTEGAFRRIVGGLAAMDAAGLDTSDAFALVKDKVVDAIVNIGGNNQKLRMELGTPVDFSEARAAVVKYYEDLLKSTTIGLSGAIYLHGKYQEILKFMDGADFNINFEPFKQSTEKSLTALQKLMEMLEKLYKPSNAKLGALKAVSGLGEALQKNGKVFTDWTDAGIDNFSTMEDTITSLATSSDGNTQVFANSLGALRAALVQVGVSGAGLKQIDQAIKENGKSAKVSKNQTKQFYAQLQNSGDAKRALLEIAEAIGAVQSAISAGLSATFAQGRAIDSVTLGWLDLTDAQDGARESIESANDAIVEANQSIQEAKDSINELTADSGKLEYQLQIAIKYGDTLRADAIRAQLDTIDTEIAGKEKDITDANKAVLASQEEIAEANSKLGINSTTRDIIEQNRVLQDMAGKYGDVAAFMITTAKPGADLTAIIDKQVEAFKNNAIQMGYTQTEAQAVADVLRTELIASMDEIPDNIRTIIEAETDAALTKVQKFAKDANARLASIKSKTITVTTIEKTVQGPSSSNFKGYKFGTINRAAGGMVTGPGTGTSDSISARLSNGEFVVKSAAVKHYGPDFFNSLNQMQTPSASMLMGSVAAATSNTVYLSTEDRQLLRSAIDRPVALYTDNTIIAKSANAGNTLLAQRGIR